MRIHMNVPPGCVLTDKGIRRVTFKKPSKRFTRRQLLRNFRRLEFGKANRIQTNLHSTNEPALQNQA